MISINSPQDFFVFFSSHGPIAMYIVLFVLMFLEGPIVTYFAAFAASLGYLNIWGVFTLAILGNQIPDVLLYILGKSLKKKSIEKFISFFGLTEKRMIWIETNIKKHSIKSILGFKVIPNLPIPGLVLSGFIKLPFKKFFWTTIILNVVLAIIYTTLGFYSGRVVSSFFGELKRMEYIIPIALVGGFLIFLLTKLVYSKLSKYFNKHDI